MTLDRAIAELNGAAVLHDAIDSVEGRAVLAPSNWTISSSSPGPGAVVRPGEKVTFLVSKPADTPRAPAPNPAEKTTSTGLDATTARAVCDMRGQNEFRYGFDARWVLGVIAEDIRDDKWFLKVEADVTNQYNAEARMNVECLVSGTPDHPVVKSFIAY